MTAKLDEIQARRAQRKAQARLLIEEQRAADYEAVDALECEHGDHNVTVVEVEHPLPGLPTLFALRCPRPSEVKRWQSRMKKGKNGSEPDGIAAAEEIATPCILYPDKDVAEEIFRARYALKLQLGQAALKIHDANIEAQGKD